MVDEELTNHDYNYSPRLNINSSEVDLTGLIVESPQNLPKKKKFPHESRKSVQGPLKSRFPLLVKPPVLPRLKMDIGQLNITQSKKSLMDSIV